MDEILTAYIRVHGECPEGEDYYIEAVRTNWHVGLHMFTSGWKCNDGWQEEQGGVNPHTGAEEWEQMTKGIEAEIAKRMYQEYINSDFHRKKVYPRFIIGEKTYTNKLGIFHPFVDWLANKIEQEELLEIEEDVLRQQEGLIKGE